ncbi:MAG: EscV/YscV/HrcV family type III secretion system export apparatus protein, partial [Chlamydiae bacterium]|nr:EscV/YscV/HrcV family type III secretion system export apparatus protein [Chlamydiota bacterium]
TTRVSSDKEDANLGRDISGQLLAHPKGILIASGVIFLLSLVPMLPGLLFFTLGAGLAGLGLNSHFQQKRKAAAAIASPAASMPTGRQGHEMIRGEGGDYALTLPVILEVGNKLSEIIRKDRDGAKFVEKMIPRMRAALYQDLGVRFPGVHVRTDAPAIEADDYVIMLNEVPLMRGKILSGSVLTNETAETLRHYNIPSTNTKNLINQNSLWVDLKYKPILDKAGIKYWETLDVMILHLSYFYRQYASEFIGIQEVRGILEFIEKSFPDLIKEVTRLVPLQKLTEIFRRLVQEQISIKDLRTILEALSEWAQTEKDTVLLTEYVRSSLKRYISYKYSKGQSVLSVYLLDPEIEDMVRGAIKQTSAGSYLALDPDSVQLILQALRSTIAPTPPGGQDPLILTAIDVRRFVRKLIEGEFPDVAVISYQEVVPEIRIQPLGRIQLS